MKKPLEPIVVTEDEEKGKVYTGKGVEKVKQIEVEYFSDTNERSVFNLVSETFRKKLSRESVQELLLMDEWELRAKVKPSPTLNRLRISFWREFDRAQNQKCGMAMSKVYSGICPREQFETYLYNDDHTAWMLKPPVDYVNAMEEALMFGIDRLREVLEVPIYQVRRIKVRDTDGSEHIETYEEFDPKTADLILKTVAMLDMRVKGALVQKVEQKVVSENRNVTANLNASVTMDQNGKVNEAMKQLGVHNIDEEIQRLENDIHKDVKKVESPFSKSELKRMIKEGIRVDEMSGIDIEKIMKKKGELDIESNHEPVIKESSDNPLENEEFEGVFSTEEEEEELIVDLDLDDL